MARGTGERGTGARGPAARRSEVKVPKPQKIAVALPQSDEVQGNWLRNFRLSGFTFMVLSLIVLSLVVLAPSLRGILEQQQEISALQKQLADKQKDVDTLKSNIDRWSDPAYITAQARDRLLYVYPGDYTYLVIDDGKTDTTKDGAPISATIQTTKVDWLHSLLTTVVEAGVTSHTAEQLLAPHSGTK